MNKITNCFMTGKSCTHERSINEELKGARKQKKAFVIMSFAPELDAIYEWQLKPFLEACKEEGEEEGYAVNRADEGAQGGYIMCEKVCREIQVADLIVADVSFNNPNVFYELGLAIALRKQVLLTCLSDNKENESINEALKNFIGIKDDALKAVEKEEKKAKIIHYPNFDIMGNTITDHLLDIPKDIPEDFEKYALFESEPANEKFVVLSPFHEHKCNGGNGGKQYPRVDDYRYITGKLLASAIGMAGKKVKEKTVDVESYYVTHEKILDKDMLKTYLNTADIQKTTNCLPGLCASIKESECVMIDISQNCIANYYWLGYLHGIGKMVVPLYNPPPKTPEPPNTPESDKEENDLAPFDIQALWRVEYNTKAPPEMLLRNLTDVIRTVHEKNNKAKINEGIWRSKFWKSILEDNEVAIFVGSMPLEVGRYSIGDWDYRTVTEIMNYLTTIKENITIKLENPQPKITKELRLDTKDGKPRDKFYEDYAAKLIERMKGNNCIIVASPDVNDYAEVALAEIYGVKPYHSIEENKKVKANFNGYIAYKTGVVKKQDGDDTMEALAFYREETATQEELAAGKAKKKRGYLFQGGGHPDEIMRDHVNATEKNKATPSAQGINRMLGQLVVAQNPFDKEHTIIIIGGVSGPATFGIAQMLTGRAYEQSNDLDEARKIPEASDCADVKEFYRRKSEELVEKIVNVRTKGGNAPRDCCAIIDVFYTNKETAASPSSDKRRVLRWDICNLDEEFTNDNISDTLKDNPMHIIKCIKPEDKC